MAARLLLILLTCVPVWAQVCRLSVAGLNRNRRVAGDIAVECPDPLHSAPFGNWGVTSNFGPKRNGHQFDGWCHEMRVCDNNGICFNVCRDGWHEWNSCTTNPLFKAPNCTLYNSRECTEQVSTQEVNVLATQTVDLAVTCPRLTPDRSRYDAGGCLDVKEYERTGNFMSAYELDPITGDDLVQSIHYPALTVRPQCNIWGCAAAGSDWVNPIAWESPASPPRVFAEMAMVVNSGTFVDSGNVCRVEPLSLQAVSSASYRGGELAADSLVSLFADGATFGTQTSAAQPPPVTLAGLQVRITPASGAARQAALTYVSSTMINVVLPSGLPDGDAAITVLSGESVRSQGTVRIGKVSPGIFTVDASGSGTAAAVITPLGGDLAVTLYGTGIRRRTSLADVAVVMGGIPVEVQAAEAVPGFAGLDQIRVRVPGSFANRGITDVGVTVDGKAANAVTISLP